MTEELKQTNIPADGGNFLTEEQVRALIVESQTNFTDIMRVKKQIIVGDNNVKIDGAGRNILVNDGTNDRILIGYLEGKF
ncbi:MAG: hypothetical protein OEV44_01030 [Spirochaetota bacterium]|nr:hypothetical protein [Spirochaetota bacterium]